MLVLLAGIIGIILTTDFFFIKKTYFDGETPATDFNRITELYDEIINIEQMKKTKISNTVALKTKAGILTFKTICKYKWKGLLIYLYTPTKLSKNIFIIPYYYGGKWYNGLLQHKNGAKRIVKITTTLACSDTTLCSGDVTKYVSKYIGPEENFYNVTITPKDLGYNNLTFIVQRDITLSELYFDSNTQITLN